ncbi:MAG: outer membrane protein transport protein [Treponema sp.]|nr:outer membrane protein transport protein [Treponema sp.]MDY2923714.1 outer membrane protein transport protein [Treponema sp.]
MKKLTVAAAAIFATAVLFAGGIDNKSNLNAGYLRNPSRSTEIKRPEAVLYNVAGTAFMEDGLAFTVGNQFIFKKYTNDLDFNNTKYEDNKNVFLFPDIEAVYKKDNWSVFAGFGVFAGGGSLDYKDGTGATYMALYGATLKKLIAAGQSKPNADPVAKQVAGNHSLEAYSVTMGEILGVSYALNENISIAAAGRFLHSTQNMKLKCALIASSNGGSDEIKYDASGYGLGGIFGINVVDLVPNFRFSAQYQTITKLEIEFDTVKGPMASSFAIVEGKKFKNDLPAVLNLGVAYQPVDNLDFSVSYSHYFNTQATMQNPLGKNDLDYKDSWELGIGCDWQVTEKIGLSGGFMYSHQGTKTDVNSAFNPVLDSFVAGCGIEYQFTKQIMTTLAYMHCRYINDDYKYNGFNMELDKDIYLASLGVTVRPFAK